MKTAISLALVCLLLIGFGLTYGMDRKCWLPEGCKAPTQPVYTENPYTYKVGTVGNVDFVEGGIVIRVQPLATYSLFTEDILLCGRLEELAKMFEGKRNPLVLTYRTRASHTVEGIGCHTLVRVDELKGQQ